MRRSASLLRVITLDVRISVGDFTAAREEKQHSAAATAEQPTSGLTLPDRPSVAVLPFANMSGDSGQEYIADGIVEDITTELSRFRDLFVIARNSSFRYKGQAVDVRQVGRELGVRYVLEGSIRRDRDRFRISAQLIDAITGAHRWAERYDRDAKDLFAVQDEIAGSVAADCCRASATIQGLHRPVFPRVIFVSGTIVGQRRRIVTVG